jgi:hypothetical protein
MGRGGGQLPASWRKTCSLSYGPRDYWMGGAAPAAGVGPRPRRPKRTAGAILAPCANLNSTSRQTSRPLHRRTHTTA